MNRTRCNFENNQIIENVHVVHFEIFDRFLARPGLTMRKTENC